MLRFPNGGFGRSDDPWFRIGTVDVNTTTLVAGLSLISFFVFAIEGNGGPIGNALYFTPAKVAGGQFWRLITWPIPNYPDIWVLLTIAIFYLFGSDIEATLGRVRFAWLLGFFTAVPTVITSVFALAVGPDTIVLNSLFFHFPVGGIRFLETGVFIAFVAFRPTAKFFFGIPGWLLAVIFIGLDILSYNGNRLWFYLFFLLLMVATSLLGTRAFGLAEELPWIPKIPLPAAIGGDPYRSKTPSRKAKKQSHLQMVNPLEEQIKQIEIDEILDQVADKGLDSLSKDQRKKLENYSKEQRKKNGK